MFSELLFLFLFSEKFWVHHKLERRVQRVPAPPCPHTSTAAPVTNSARQSGAYLTKDEPPAAHRHHPKSAVYVRAHSRRCGGCGSGHPCDDSSPSLSFPMGFFLCPKNPPLCPPPSLSFQVCVLVSLTHFSKFSAIISLHISSAHSFSLGFPSGIPITHPSECSISSQSSRYSVSFSVSLFCSVRGIFRAVFERGDAFLGRMVPLVSPSETSFLSFCASNVSI